MPVDSLTVIRWGTTFAHWFPLAFFLMMVPFSVLWGAFVVFVLASIARLASTSTTLSVSSLLRLSSVARTPAMLASTTLTALGISLPLSFFTFGFIDLVMMAFAVRSAVAPVAHALRTL